MDKDASIKNFDLTDAISRTTAALNLPEAQVEAVVKQFLRETENGLAEHGAIHYMNHFSVKLRKRKPRKGKLKGVAWETPSRVEPEFEASALLKKKIEEKQGLPCA